MSQQNVVNRTVEVTDENFEEMVLRSAIPVLVDFWAAWCGPCLAMAPGLEELAAEYQERFIIAKLDVDKNPKTAMAYRISSMPTLLVFRNGQVVDKQVGALPKVAVRSRMEAVLA